MQVIFKSKKPNVLPKTYYAIEGSVLTENYNETLDSALIKLAHIEEALDIEPFDKVILRDEKGRIADRYMCVDSFTETMENLDPVLFSYEINLFSETKELEGISLPNLTITQADKEQQQSILDYLQNYINLFGTKIRKYVDGVMYFDNKYSLEDTEEFANKFSAICPEMQWNNPTLREVLTDLMMVVDCIPVLRNNVIGFIDLTVKKSDISLITGKINYIERSQSSEDYVSELKMNIQNSMQVSLDGIKNSTNRVEYLTFVAQNDGNVVTDQNICLKTQYPILKIKHLWMAFEGYVVVRDTSIENPSDIKRRVMYKVDLCNLYDETTKQTYNFVPEYNVYKCKDIQALTSLSGISFAEANNYQNYNIYFIRGDRTIGGFNEQLRYIYGEIKETTSFYVLKQLIDRNATPVHLENNYEIVRRLTNFAYANTYYSTLFSIEYEALTDMVFQAGRELPRTNTRVIIDNQTNSYVNAYNQGFMEYQKANRLGNDQLLINARYENSYYNLIKIGDFFKDSIVFQTQYQIYENHIEVNALATKDYILRDYFTGVKAKVRSWKIADGNDALTRHDLNKYYLEFSFRQKEEIIDLDYDMAYYFLSPLYQNQIEPIKYCVAKFVCNNVTYPSGTNGFNIDLVGKVLGNSIVFAFGCKDNYEVGKRVSDEVTTNEIIPFEEHQGDPTKFPYDTMLGFYTWRIKAADWSDSYGGIKLETLRYVDTDGEFTNVEYFFFTKQEQGVVDLTETSVITDQREKEFMAYHCKHPVMERSAWINNTKFSTNKLINKDNREIFKLSTQFEFCSDTHDIVFTKKFVSLQQCIRELSKEDMQEHTGSTPFSILPNEWVQRGGPQTLQVSVSGPTGIVSDDVRVGFYKSLSVWVTPGTTMQSYSISNTVPGYTNIVNWVRQPITVETTPTDASLDTPMENSTSTDVEPSENYNYFEGQIYFYKDNPESATATITYVREDSPVAYWYKTKEVVVPELIGANVVSSELTGNVFESDTVRIRFDSETGTFSVFINTINMPSLISPRYYSIQYTYNFVTDNKIVQNRCQIYKQVGGTLDFKRPTLSNAVLTDLTFTVEEFGEANSTHLDINDSNVTSDTIYYIVSGSNGGDENILLAIKGNTTVYLNVLLTRDYNIYDEDGDISSQI